jgi:hypothetical protein
LDVEEAVSPAHGAPVEGGGAELEFAWVGLLGGLGRELEVAILAQVLSIEGVRAKFLRLGLAELADAGLAEDHGGELVGVLANSAHASHVTLSAVAEDSGVGGADGSAECISGVVDRVRDWGGASLGEGGADGPVGVDEAARPASGASIEFRLSELTLLRVETACVVHLENSGSIALIAEDLAEERITADSARAGIAHRLQGALGLQLRSELIPVVTDECEVGQTYPLAVRSAARGSIADSLSNFVSVSVLLARCTVAELREHHAEVRMDSALNPVLRAHRSTKGPVFIIASRILHRCDIGRGIASARGHNRAKVGGKDSFRASSRVILANLVKVSCAGSDKVSLVLDVLRNLGPVGANIEDIESFSSLAELVGIGSTDFLVHVRAIRVSGIFDSPLELRVVLLESSPLG